MAELPDLMECVICLNEIWGPQPATGIYAWQRPEDGELNIQALCTSCAESTGISAGPIVRLHVLPLHKEAHEHDPDKG